MKIGEIEKERIKDYIKKNIPSLINLTEEICRIPSPTGQEEKKAHSIFDRLSEDQVSIDEVENVLYLHNNIDESNRIIVVAAHIDTVFPDNIEIKPEIRDNKLYAPSVLDNSVNVAALLFIIEMFNKLNINFKKGILFAFNVGEEGLGNLKGIRHIVDKWKSNIDGVIAVDGGYEKIVNKAVGSMRYRLEINTEGGHSWSNFGNENAILHAARLIDRLYKINVPKEPKTTYNVGLINGGISVNTIAQNAEMMLDFRSEEGSCLEQLIKEYERILLAVHDNSYDKVSRESKLIGERPCGINYHNPYPEIIEAVREDMGMVTEFASGSTDANIPMSMGIPAISFGVGKGFGSHTTEEYLEIDSLETGLEHLIRFILEVAK
jgi:tripeptide aminopeptidase